jgi:hypothetical protein
MRETCSLRGFWRGFLRRRRDRPRDKCMECIPRVGLHFLAALRAGFNLSRSRHGVQSNMNQTNPMFEIRTVAGRSLTVITSLASDSAGIPPAIGSNRVSVSIETFDTRPSSSSRQ